MKRTALVIVFASVLSVFACERAGYAQKVYLLATGDTKDREIGHADGIDMGNIALAFRAQIPKNQLVVYGSLVDDSTWRGPPVEQADNMKAAILDAIDGCPATPNDTIVFFWSGHGMYDSGGHYLLMPARIPLYRSEVIAAIQKKAPRLAVVISDSCNVLVDSKRLGPPPPCAVPSFTLRISPLFDQLFFRQQGMVDINAASEGEKARCFPFPGGLFTSALTFYEESRDQRGHPNGRNIEVEVRPPSGHSYAVRIPFGFFWKYAQERKTWNDLVTHVNQTMRTSWGKTTQQTVRVWSMPTPAPEPLGPAGRIPSVLSLTRNDVILSVNGNAVNDKAECEREIDNSGKIMEFTVRDSRDGTVWRMQTGLRDTDPRFGVYLDDARGGGALVTAVVFASPATFNSVLERVAPGQRPPPGNIPSVLSLSHGDIILSINGRAVKNEAECRREIGKAGRNMEFTVRDSRDGTVWRMQTTVRRRGTRFGVYLDDAPGGGALVTKVEPDSSATHNLVLERVEKKQR